MKWTKKVYARELKKGYWNLEPHFYYYSMLEVYDLFRTFCIEKMSVDDVNSALYGKFVCEGKPIIKGFYGNMNLTNKILNEIMKEKKTKKVIFYVKKKGSKKRKKVTFLSRK